MVTNNNNNNNNNSASFKILKSPDAQAYWDLPVYADHTCVKDNRVDARFADHKGKKVWAVCVAEEAIPRL